MLLHRNYKELVVIGLSQGEVLAFSHACTLIHRDLQPSKKKKKNPTSPKKQRSVIKLLDNNKDEVLQYPEPVKAGACERLNFVAHFGKYEVTKIYCIERRKVNEEEALRINNQMTLVMTGRMVYLKERKD